MREAVFSSMGERIREASVLDLFAGSGSYGLEALSRGATSAVFVEKHPHAVAALQDNVRAVLKSLGDPKEIQTKVIRRDVMRFDSSMEFPLIFMDPPYELVRTHSTQLLEQVRSLLAPGGVLVYELPGDVEVPSAGWDCLKRIGKSGANEPSIALMEVAS
jgi:16S rRNA (guanine966-N2)-methyltransferase